MQEAIAKKADSLGCQLRIGKGKKSILIGMLTQAIGKPCPYCGIGILLATASIDHKVPYANNSLRRSGSRAEKAMVDGPENLHIVCNKCNAMKEDFTHDEYNVLLKFMESNPAVGEKLRKRLARSRSFWRKR